MEREKIIEDYNSFKVILIIYIIGLAGHTFSVTRPLMLYMTPYALLASAMIILYPFVKYKEYKHLFYICTWGVIAFVIEIFGVSYGLFFGDYSYSSILGFKIFGVPAIIAVNWVTVLFGSLSLCQLITGRKLLQIILTPIFILIFDFIMEPIAIALGYWTWYTITIPVQNYITWSVISLNFSFFWIFLKWSNNNKQLPAFLFMIQSIYFLLLYFIV